MADRTVVILNPRAGRGTGARLAAEIERLAGCDVWLTEGPRHATRLAQEAVAKGYDAVVAAGGDGALHEVLNGLSPGVRLGLIPIGTGNDFARHVGLGDWRAGVRTLADGRATAIDCGEMNAGGETLRFLNVCGCGFDAAVAARINRGFHFLRGTAAYLAAVAVTLARFRPFDLRLSLDDGQPENRRVMLCAVANASSYGGGMRIAPPARIDDGLLDVVLVGAVTKAEFMRSFRHVLRGTHLDHPAVTHARAATVRLETARPMPLVIDGEVRGLTPATFTCRPGAVTMLLP